MSEDIAPVTEQEPVGSPEVSSEQASSPEPSILDVSQYGDYRIPVKLDGEELQVPLSEAIAGYQRQADYTRKTQELAEQRNQLQFASTLQTALERDPATTIDLLARHYGISRQEAADMVADEFDDLDPQEQRIREMDRRIAQFEEYQSQQQIEREIARIQSRYQDFDAAEVINAAMRLGTTDLEGTYKQVAFDKLMKQQEIQRKASEIQQAEDARIVESKRQAAVVDGGSSATGSTTDEDIAPISSLSDAWFAAKRQLNANF